MTDTLQLHKQINDMEKQKETSKKILRRITEHVIAVNALYTANGLSSQQGLTQDDLAYMSEYAERIALKLTGGPLNLGDVHDIVKYWKSI